MLISTVWNLRNLLKISDNDFFIDSTGIYQIVSTVIIILFIYFLSPELSSSKFVFTTYYNETGFNSKAFVSLIGLLTALYAFVGYEAGGALAEETANPRVNAPKGILETCIISAILGFITILAILYGCQENIDFVLHGSGDSIYNLFFLVTNGKSGIAYFFTAIIASNVFFAGFF